MVTSNNEIKNKILRYLESKPEGATCSEIAKNINHNRITVTKYLQVLKANNILTSRNIAQGIFYQKKQSNGRNKILIVDDEPHIVELIKLSLSKEKYDTIGALSGLEAIEKVYTEHPDLIILDLMMPGINGFEVCKRLKENKNTKDIPVIILSAKTEMKSKMQGISAGAEDYITKPFDPLELESHISRIIKNKEESNKNALIAKNIEKKMNINTSLSALTFKIQNLDHYAKKYGRTKADEVGKFIEKMIYEKVKAENGEIIKLNSNETVCIMEKSNGLNKTVCEDFRKMLPFFYIAEKTNDTQKKFCIDIECTKNNRDQIKAILNSLNK